MEGIEKLEKEIKKYLGSSKIIDPDDFEQFLYKTIKSIYGIEKETVKKYRLLNPIWWSYATPFYDGKISNNGSKSYIRNYQEEDAEKLWKRYRNVFLERMKNTL